jgi:hypothetical protein
VAFAARHAPGFGQERDQKPRQRQDPSVDPVAMSLLSSQPGSLSPAWERVMRLAEERSGAAASG